MQTIYWQGIAVSRDIPPFAGTLFAKGHPLHSLVFHTRGLGACGSRMHQNLHAGHMPACPKPACGSKTSLSSGHMCTHSNKQQTHTKRAHTQGTCVFPVDIGQQGLPLLLRHVKHAVDKQPHDHRALPQRQREILLDAVRHGVLVQDLLPQRLQSRVLGHHAPRAGKSCRIWHVFGAHVMPWSAARQ